MIPSKEKAPTHRQQQADTMMFFQQIDSSENMKVKNTVH